MSGSTPNRGAEHYRKIQRTVNGPRYYNLNPNDYKRLPSGQIVRVLPRIRGKERLALKKEMQRARRENR